MIPKNFSYEKFLYSYNNQKRSAAHRGISWEFTFETWCAWWFTDHRWLFRGTRRNDLCMARDNDSGPYSPDNVHCATNAQNGQEKKGRPWTPAQHAASKRSPRSRQKRPVYTPSGRFPSVTAAAKHFGFSPANGVRLAKDNLHGWSYV